MYFYLVNSTRSLIDCMSNYQTRAAFEWDLTLRKVCWNVFNDQVSDARLVQAIPLRIGMSGSEYL